MRTVLRGPGRLLLMFSIPLRELGYGLLLILCVLCEAGSAAEYVAKAETAKNSDITIERVLGPEYPDQRQS